MKGLECTPEIEIGNPYVGILGGIPYVEEGICRNLQTGNWYKVQELYTGVKGFSFMSDIGGIAQYRCDGLCNSLREDHKLVSPSKAL